METFVIPVTFPDLDTAKRDGSTFLDRLRTSGLAAEMPDAPVDDGEADAGRPDPGPTTLELQVHAESGEEARRQVETVMDGQFPPGMVLLGEPIRL
ncbi:hypothetical protein GC089_16995 [Cellulomonas sp. JZ18]|uniref:hypothetical protein n=1 Tax=Cellulomonas sp. JZ18 TaxID=2654191 RepID=UPI0012D42EB3|nr:hypothetical protein [Cellulomonas sp. JZ18]QGQ20572.1 hypothetical protein GC089_16995 [Cellulomonas sp. JZ18]